MRTFCTESILVVFIPILWAFAWFSPNWYCYKRCLSSGLKLKIIKISEANDFVILFVFSNFILLSPYCFTWELRCWIVSVLIFLLSSFYFFTFLFLQNKGVTFHPRFLSTVVNWINSTHVSTRKKDSNRWSPSPHRWKWFVISEGRECFCAHGMKIHYTTYRFSVFFILFMFAATTDRSSCTCVWCIYYRRPQVAIPDDKEQIKNLIVS